MRKGRIAFWAIIIIAVIAFIGISYGKTKTVKTGGMLSVNDIQANPSAYKGTITVTGVVARRSDRDSKLFSMIDTTEAKHCKSTGCAKFYLPVRFDGPAPKEWDEVNVTGQIVKQDSLIFQASKLDIVRHLTVR